MIITKKFNAMKKLAFIYMIFWASETLFFLIRDGWHLKAVCKEEIICDGIVSVIGSVVIFLFVWCTADILELFANANRIAVVEKIEITE